MIVLDTHVWVWHLGDPKRLSARARRAIGAAEELAVSVISCLEVATLARLGRLKLDRDVGSWVAQALDQDRSVLLGLEPDVAVAAGSLADGFPGDPADRVIYATAKAHRARLVTKDRALRRYDPELTLW